MFITITRTGLHRIGVGLGVFAVLTTVFILFPRENAEPTAAEQAVPASVSDWGLSFQTEGQPPAGNVSAEELRQYNAFYVGDTSRKTIYLTRATRTAARLLFWMRSKSMTRLPAFSWWATSSTPRRNS